MSDSNRGNDNRLGWVIPGLVFSALIVLAMLSGATFSNYSIWKESQENAKQIETYSKRYVVERCHVTNAVATFECIKQATQAAQDQQRNEADLYAQRQMGIWAVVVGVCATISIPLSLAGIFFVWRSLALNRDAVKAAIAANETAREMGEAQVRAYLTVKDSDLVRGSDMSFGFNFSILNTGDSPAYNVTVGVGSATVTDSNQSFPYLIGATGPGYEIPSGKDKRIETAQSVNGEGAVVLILIHIFYTDVFKKHWNISYGFQFARSHGDTFGPLQYWGPQGPPQ